MMMMMIDDEVEFCINFESEAVKKTTKWSISLEEGDGISLR